MTVRELITAVILFVLAILTGWAAFPQNNTPLHVPQRMNELPQATPTPTPQLILEAPPRRKTIPGGVHVFQTFNNCGPASLSMALSLYGISVSQQELGSSLRPYQNKFGDNDDKSVTLAELAEKSKEYGFIPYLRPGGTPQQIRQFITYDIPVIVRTTTKPSEDIGHFRVIKGYDGEAGHFIQDDSLQGKDLAYTYDAFNALWETFGYEFLVLVPSDKQLAAEAILGPLRDERLAWETAAQSARAHLDNDPNALWPGFNLAVALYHTGDWRGSVDAFERVESRLPFRTLWYQIEPIYSYYELGMYDRVFALSNRILNNENRAYSELYLIRGHIYRNQQNPDRARIEYERALRYNENLTAAREALSSLQ